MNILYLSYFFLIVQTRNKKVLRDYMDKNDDVNKNEDHIDYNVHFKKCCHEHVHFFSKSVLIFIKRGFKMLKMNDLYHTTFRSR